MTPSDHYDSIIIGSGQGGTPLARALAEAGRRTALIERAHIGGTCINEGCTPTKTMVASARVAYLASRGADYGVRTGPIRIDQQRIRQRKRDIVTSFRTGSEDRLKQTANLDLLFGEASFTGTKSLRVELNDGGRRSLTAQQIFINAGARSAKPPIDGLDAVPGLDNISIMELDVVPEHLLVLGGGYIGVEFGQMFRRFGSRVTIVQSGAQLLSREDADVAEEVARIFREDGIDVWLGARAQRLRRTGNQIQMDVVVGGRQETFSGSHLLLGIGRVPNTDRLNLAAAGIAVDAHGFVKVNNRLETNVAGVYALGDVNGGPAFTHISYDDFRIIRNNLLENKNVTTDGRMVPYTVYMDPQLGRIGLSESQARAQRRNILVAKMPMASVARAIETGETRGFMKAVVDAATGQILGVAVLGIEGGEIMSMFEIAMMGKLPYTVLREAIFAHPTLAESLNNLFQSLT